MQDHDVKIGNVGESKLNFQQYLTRPIERIQEYIKLLQDIMRYSAQAGEDTGPSKVGANTFIFKLIQISAWCLFDAKSQGLSELT